MNGELGMQKLLCAHLPGPLTAALLQFTIQSSQFTIALAPSVTPCLVFLAWPLPLWYADAEFLGLRECRQNVIVFTLEMRANTYEYERHK